MTPEERGSANNLIYLCGPHHDAIDSQLEKHTKEFLVDAKSVHEQSVARAIRSALGVISYEELSIVCAVIAATPPAPSALGIERALPLGDKIALNRLGELSKQRITDGLSQANRVHDFIAFQSALVPAFGRQLAARFKSDYFDAQARGLQPDEIFDYLVERAYEHTGPRDTPQVRAAALSVIAYLFELCEIFERA